MKTPDKIYIAERNAGFTDIVDMMWTYGKRSDPAVTNVDYIRKETLLEWLKSERKKCESKDTELWQRLNTFTDVIKKVESL